MNELKQELFYAIEEMNCECVAKDAEKLCRNICSDVLHGKVNPNELETSATRFVSEDRTRVFVSMKMKKGFNITVPVDKNKPYFKELNKKTFKFLYS